MKYWIAILASACEEFLMCFRSQAERKPDSPTAVAVRNNIAARITANPLDNSVRL